MTRPTNRVLAVLSAASLFLALGAAPVFAQTTPGAANVGPAGGVGSTTAPSNSQGTPAGGTGTLSTTRVGPAGVGHVPSPNTSPDRARYHTTARRHHYRHNARRHHMAKQEIGTQSQMGKNGAASPPTK